MKIDGHNPQRVVVVGGGGHIGLPLSLVLARIGHDVIALDSNQDTVKKINNGEMPFTEEGAAELLLMALDRFKFKASADIRSIENADVVIVCIGTPVDEHMSPVPRIFIDLLDSMKPYLNSSQLLILRSTVYPGTTKLAARHLQDIGIDIAFCPERIVQGQAIEELTTLPAIVSGISKGAELRAAEIFSSLGKVVIASVEEAEFAKLFLNTYRYIEFATTNQLYTIANDAGVDYARVLEIMKQDYPRASKLPRPGLTAGPCLMKDTMQLVSYSQNRFTLGTAAFFANEGLALYIVENVMRNSRKEVLKVALLGMAFKANNDDIRSSLSYRVKKAFLLAGAEVIAADSRVNVDKTLVTEAQAIEACDVVVICAPHQEYSNLDYRNKQVVDIWNLLGKGSLIDVFIP
jgi:UDP-N-acetyl-D-mannosaminuronic acid dehydrogenase